MSTFSATDVALEGFRVTRENPRATLIWAAVSLVVSVVSGLVAISLGQEARMAFDVISGQEPPSGPALLAALKTLTPLLIMGFAVQCVMVTAVYRIVLRHADHGFGYLKLGADEVRLGLLTLIYFCIAVALLMGVSIVAGVVVLLASKLGPVVADLVGLGVFVFALGLLVYVAVRLSLAPAITFDLKRLAVFESWAITRGAFWRLLGAYLLAVACMFVVTILALSLFFALVLIVNGGDAVAAARMAKPDETSIGAYFTPVSVPYLVLAAALTAIYYPVVAAPAAVAYRALTGRAAAPGEPLVDIVV